MPLAKQARFNVLGTTNVSPGPLVAVTAGTTMTPGPKSTKLFVNVENPVPDIVTCDPVIPKFGLMPVMEIGDVDVAVCAEARGAAKKPNRERAAPATPQKTNRLKILFLLETIDNNSIIPTRSDISEKISTGLIAQNCWWYIGSSYPVAANDT